MDILAVPSRLSIAQIRNAGENGHATFSPLRPAVPSVSSAVNLRPITAADTHGHFQCESGQMATTKMGTTAMVIPLAVLVASRLRRASHEKALSPVIAWPMISVWMSSVPS